MGAVLLLVGLVVAAITSPLFDRVLTNHLALSAKIALPIMAACWLSLIWESASHLLLCRQVASGR